MPPKKKVESKPVDLEKLQSIGVQTAKVKKYGVDVRTVWDKERDHALVTSEVGDDGKQFIETRNPTIQEKLEKMGYKDGERVLKMHDPNRNNRGIVSEAKAQKNLASGFDD